MKLSFLDRLKLNIGRRYNLNTLKQIKVTEDFLSLKKDVRDCQNDESYDDCKTKEYMDTLWKTCKCLPFNIRQSNNVQLIYYSHGQKSVMFCVRDLLTRNI